MSLENGTRRNPSSLDSTPCYEHEHSTDSPQSVYTDSFSVNSSLMSSIVDRLSLGGSIDQEAIVSGESQDILPEKNGSETFSVLQSPESVVDLTPEENGVASELLKLSNGKNEMDELHLMDSLISNSCLLLAEDKVGSVCTECNQNPQSEHTESSSKHLFQEKDYPDSCKMESPLNKSDLQSTLNFLEEAGSLNETLVNVKIPFSAGESIGWDTGVETYPEEQHHSVPKELIDNLPSPSKEVICSQEGALPGQGFQETLKAMSFNNTVDEQISNTHDSKPERSASSDEEDIYGHSLPYSSSETSVTDMAGCLAPQDKVRTNVEEGVLVKSDQVCT